MCPNMLYWRMRAYRGWRSFLDWYMGNGRGAVGLGKEVTDTRKLRVLRISGHSMQPRNWGGWAFRRLNKYIFKIDSLANGYPGWFRSPTDEELYIESFWKNEGIRVGRESIKSNAGKSDWPNSASTSSGENWRRRKTGHRLKLFRTTKTCTVFWPLPPLRWRCYVRDETEGSWFTSHKQQQFIQNPFNIYLKVNCKNIKRNKHVNEIVWIIYKSVTWDLFVLLPVGCSLHASWLRVNNIFTHKWWLLRTPS